MYCVNSIFNKNVKIYMIIIFFIILVIDFDEFFFLIFQIMKIECFFFVQRMEYLNVLLFNSMVIGNVFDNDGDGFVYEFFKVFGYVQVIIIIVYLFIILLLVGGNGIVCYIVFWVW